MVTSVQFHDERFPKFLFGKEVTDSQEDDNEWTQNPLRRHLWVTAEFASMTNQCTIDR
jgi:hypothetical protein